MSTRCSIWYSDWYSDEPLDLHLYAEAFDDTIWIELRNGASTTTFQIPQEMMKAILASETCKHYAEHGADTDWVDQLPDLSKCPNCGGPADNGHSRELPPSPYYCTKCNREALPE